MGGLKIAGFVMAFIGIFFTVIAMFYNYSGPTGIFFLATGFILFVVGLVLFIAEREKVEKWLKVKKLIEVGWLILFFVHGFTSYFFLIVGVRIFFFFDVGIYGGFLLLVISYGILKSHHPRKIREWKFFCPMCEEYAFAPRNRPNCLKCNTEMYHVRYCPKCRQSDIAVSQFYWKCLRCGSRLKKITRIVQVG